MEAIGEWKRAGREFVVATQRRLAAARTCNPNEVRQVRVAAAAKGGDESELTTAFSKDLFETTLRGLLPKLDDEELSAELIGSIAAALRDGVAELDLLLDQEAEGAGGKGQCISTSLRGSLRH